MERESTATYVGHFGMSRLLFSSGCLSSTLYRSAFLPLFCRAVGKNWHFKKRRRKRERFMNGPGV